MTTEINSLINVEISGKKSKQGANQIKKDLDDIDKKADELKKSTKKTSDEFGKFTKKGAQGTKKLSRGFKQVDKDASRFNKNLQRDSKGSIKALVGYAAGFITISVALKAVITTTTEFEQSISQLSSITGASGKDLEFYAEQAKDIGRSTTLSASQAAEAFKLIASAKPDLLSSADALNAVTREAVTLAEAANLELPVAANALGNALNQFSAGADEANRFINILAAGSKFGASSIAATSLALKNSGAAAKAAGLSFEEANAGIQALAAGGIVAAEAGTGLRNILLILEQETDAKLRPSMVGLAQAIDNLKAKELSLTEVTDIFGRESAIAALTLIEQSDALFTLEKQLTGTQTAAEQARINFDNLAGDTLRFKSATESLSISIGEKLLPGLSSATQGATDFIISLERFITDGDLERWTEITGKALDIWGDDVKFLIKALDEGFGKLFGNMMDGSLDATTIMQVTFATTLSNIKTAVQITTIEVASLFDKFRVVLKNNAKTWEEVGELTAGIDRARIASAQDVLNANKKELDGIFDLIKAFKEERDEIEFLERSTNNLTGSINELNDSNFEAWQLAQDVRDKTNRMDEGFVSAANSVGILKTEFTNLGNPVVDIDSLLDSLNPKLETTGFRMQGVKDTTFEMWNELDRATEAGKRHDTMVEGVQRSWENLIFETLSSGKIEFDSFFDSILDGFKRLVAGMIAENIAGIVFGGKGVGSIFSGLTGLIPGVGGGGVAGAAVSAATGTTGTSGVSLAATALSKLGIRTPSLNAALSNLGLPSTLQGPTQSGQPLTKGFDIKQIGLNLVAGFAGSFAGNEVGKLISGKTAQSNTGATVGGIVGASVGGPVGAFIGSAIGGIVDVLSGGDDLIRQNVGLLAAPTPGVDPSRTFGVDPFESGFAPTGFARRGTQAEANEVIDVFRNVDLAITQLTRSLGGNIDLSRATLSGVGEEGRLGTSGTFLGIGSKTENFVGQLDFFATQLVDHISGLPDAIQEALSKATTAEEIGLILNEALLEKEQNISEALQKEQMILDAIQKEKDRQEKDNLIQEALLNELKLLNNRQEDLIEEFKTLRAGINNGAMATVESVKEVADNLALVGEQITLVEARLEEERGVV